MSQSRDLAESSSSSSRTATSVPWIFLSHSGHQKDFTRRLNEELVHAGHSPFFDQDGEFSLPKGRPFPERILESCEGCKMGIIVLSSEYMESFWPMLELQQLKNAQVLLYPLFYQMQPADLTSDENLRRWQHKCDTWQSRASDLQKTISSRGSGIQINKDIASWAAALKELKDRSGDVRTAYKSDDDYLNTIISHVCATIPPPQSYKLSDDVKGGARIQQEMDKHFEQHGRSAANGVTMLGVFGIGGSGKSTACKHMTNYYSKEFPGRSFYLELPSNKDESQNLLIKIKGILSKLIAKSRHKIATLDQAMAILQDSLHRNKVFLALDNVWDDGDGAGWDMAKKIMLMYFMPGSKIMVTSRSEKVLKALFRCRKTCESEQQHSNIVHVLSITEDEAMEALMSYSCLSHFIPQEGLRSLARSCFFHKQCHPLYLKMIGAELRQEGRASFSDQAWEELFFELQSKVKQGDSESIVVDVIKKSLEKLSPELQDIFKNLVTCMPPQIRSYGYISLEEMCSWLSFLQADGFTTKKIRSKLLKLEYHGLLEIREAAGDIIIHDLHKFVAKSTLSPDAPANYFLDVKDSEHLSEKEWSKYKYIYGEYHIWRNRTPILAKKFLSVKHMKALSILELEGCEVEGISGWEGAPNLMFLKLYQFHHLKDIGHLGSLLKLEVLIVKACHSLKVVKVGRIPKLRILNLSGNSGLVDFFFVQSSVWSPSNLQELDVSRCGNLKRLPNLRHSDGLRTLRADDCSSLEEVRISPLAFTSLEVFDLSSGCQLRVQDATRSSLTALEFLTSTFCDHHGPKDSAAGSSVKANGLVRLQRLILTPYPLKDLAAGSSVNVNGLVINVGGLASLEVLHLGFFPALQEIASLSSLVKLRDLCLTGCGSLKEITGLGALSNLENLDALCCSSLQKIDLGALTKLGKLSILKCSSLQKIDLGALTKLGELFIEKCSSLQKIDLGALAKLGYLSIETCSSLQKIDLGALTKLGQLSIEQCSSLQKIDSLGALAKLNLLSIQNCTSLQKIDLGSLGAFTQLTILHAFRCSSLQKIDLGALTKLVRLFILRCSSLQKIDSLGALTKVGTLSIKNCSSLQKIDSLGALTKLGELSILNCSSLRRIDSLGALAKLDSLSIQNCTSLQKIDLDSLGAFTNLRICSSLHQITGLGTELRNLIIQRCPLLSTNSLGLPTFSSSLGRLRWLTLESFPSLQEIASLSSLVNLHRLCLDHCASLKEIIITGLGAFTNLKFLRVRKCSSLQKIAIGMGALTQLQKLEIRDCSSLQQIIGLGTHLTVLYIKDCLSLQQIIGLGTHLTRLHYLWIEGCPLLASLSEPLIQLHTFSTLEIEKMKELAKKKAKEERQEFEKLEPQELQEARFWLKTLKKQEEDNIGMFFMARPVRAVEEELSRSRNVNGTFYQLFMLGRTDLEGKLPQRTDLKRTLRAAVEEEGRPLMLDCTDSEEDTDSSEDTDSEEEERQPAAAADTSATAAAIANAEEAGKAAKPTGLHSEVPKQDAQVGESTPTKEDGDLASANLQGSKDSDKERSKQEIQPEFETVDPLKMVCKGTLEQVFTLPSLPTSLEDLVINGCSSLVDVSSLTSLTSLKYLNLEYCTSLKELPNFQHLSNIEGIYLKGCSTSMIKHAKQMLWKGEVKYTAFRS